MLELCKRCYICVACDNLCFDMEEKLCCWCQSKEKHEMCDEGDCKET